MPLDLLGTIFFFWNFAYDDICSLLCKLFKFGYLSSDTVKYSYELSFCLQIVVLNVPEMLVSLIFLMDLVISLMCLVTEKRQIVAMQLSLDVLYLWEVCPLI